MVYCVTGRIYRFGAREELSGFVARRYLDDIARLFGFSSFSYSTKGWGPAEGRWCASASRILMRLQKLAAHTGYISWRSHAVGAKFTIANRSLICLFKVCIPSLLFPTTSTFIINTNTIAILIFLTIYRFFFHLRDLHD